MKLSPVNTFLTDTFQADDTGFFCKESLAPQNLSTKTSKLLEIIHAEINVRNDEIRKANDDFRKRVTKEIVERKSRLREQQNATNELSKLIPIELRTNPSSPIIPFARREEIILNPPVPSGRFQSQISQPILNQIIDVLIRGGRSFEATPNTCANFEEEDFRNLLIFFLNGAFQIRAAAEAFNKKGKTDILLEYSGNNVFITECKIWKGASKYFEAIDQLLGYLTWRETIAVLLSFVKERDFTSIIEKVRKATIEHSSYVNDSLIQKDSSHLLSTHIFPEDKDKPVLIHHLLFTIPPTSN